MAGTIDFQVDGIDELMRKMVQISTKAPQAMGTALYQEAEGIMGKSKPLVPVLTGSLRSSGHVQLPSIIGSGVSVSLGYGGPAAFYAWHVHENLLDRHAVGQAKYLEQPLLEAKGGMLARISAKVKEQILNAT